MVPIQCPLNAQMILVENNHDNNNNNNQPWDFFGGNHAKAETPVLWPPHVKS